jgi:hypothetical protein
MKTLILLLSLSIVSLNLAAQEKQLEKPVKANTSTEQATIVFNNDAFDYGDIEYNGNGECTFTFANTGKEPIMLTSVRASCGCTAPSWSKDPIKPGDTGEIKVKYNTHIVGPFSKTITVSSNGIPSHMVLRIKGRVLPRQEDLVQE